MAMSKTSAMLIQEFNTIMDNAEKLVVGEKYKYAKLMETLGLPVKANGSTKINQIKRVKQYLNWDSKTKIYSGINEDAIPALKKTNTSEYYEPIKDCLIYELNLYIAEHKEQESLFITQDELLSMWIDNKNFFLAERNCVSVIVGEILNLTTNGIKEYSKRLSCDVIEICDNALNNMQKEGLIQYKKVNELNCTKDNHDEINVEDSDNYFDAYVISLDKINTTNVCNKELYLQKKKELKNKLKEKMLTCKAKEFLNAISKDCIDEIQINEKINKLNAVLIDNDEEFNELLLKRLNDMGVDIKESRKRILRKLNSSISTTLKNDNNVYNCIYRWVNENNEIVYIGKTKDLVQRTRMHFVARNDELHKKWLTNNLRVEYVSFDEYGDCSVAEPYFIMKHKPIGNSDFTANDISISIPQFDELEWKEFDFNYSF